MPCRFKGQCRAKGFHECHVAATCLSSTAPFSPIIHYLLRTYCCLKVASCGLWLEQTLRQKRIELEAALPTTHDGKRARIDDPDHPRITLGETKPSDRWSHFHSFLGYYDADTPR